MFRTRDLVVKMVATKTLGHPEVNEPFAFPNRQCSTSGGFPTLLGSVLCTPSEERTERDEVEVRAHRATLLRLVAASADRATHHPPAH